jgi:hypothetical protein
VYAQSLGLRQRLGEREIAQIEGHDLDHLGNGVNVHGRKVATFQVDHAVVATKSAAQLTDPHVDRVDPACAPSKERCGEATRARAQINRHAT